jgi:hypothetical protein
MTCGQSTPNNSLIPVLGPVKVSPFTQVGSITFGIDPGALVGLIGQPRSERVNHVGQMEFDYGSTVYRFDATSTLVEITADAPTLDLDGHLVPFSYLPSYLQEHDQSAFERLGFLVSPRFGIAADTHFPSWVTAFPEQSLDIWRAIGDSNAGA